MDVPYDFSIPWLNASGHVDPGTPVDLTIVPTEKGSYMVRVFAMTAGVIPSETRGTLVVE
jgi:heme/copper-type cytochrome/quinol oxidase subunit 2